MTLNVHGYAIYCVKNVPAWIFLRQIKHIVHEDFSVCSQNRKIIVGFGWNICKIKVLMQYTVTHTNTSIFNIEFSNLYLRLLALFLVKDYVSYKNKLASFYWPQFRRNHIYVIAIVKFSNIENTAWKVSKYGVLSCPYFSVFGLNTGKYEPEIIPYLGTFQAVKFFQSWLGNLYGFSL